MLVMLAKHKFFCCTCVKSCIESILFYHCNYILMECTIFLNMGYWCKFYAV